jgi:tetratricopeptide (TPR) repeat protein
VKPISAPLRLLCAAPRPGAVRPLPSRASVEAIYAAAEAQGEGVAAEWLWPPRFEALAARLGAADQPAIEAVYLDATVTGVENNGSDQGGNPMIVWESLPPDAQPLPAERLLDILAEHHVRLLILNVHTSSDRQDGIQPLEAWAEALPDRDLALLLLDGRLDAASVQHLMTGLLAVWLAGETLSQAVDAIHASETAFRFRPYGAAEAQVAPERVVRRVGGAELKIAAGDVERDGVAKVVRFPSPELTPAWQRLAEMPAPGGLPAEPLEGLVGRALELGLLEGALRAEPSANGGERERDARAPTGGVILIPGREQVDRTTPLVGGERGRDARAPEGVVWVLGYEGLGKTTLATHMARWLVRSGRFEQAVYTSFQGGGRQELALHDLAIRLGIDLPAKDQDATLDAVIAALEETPTLILWDNVEQLLPGGDLALDEQGLDALWSAAARIARAGSSRLLMISDGLDIPRGISPALPTAFTLTMNPLTPEDALAFLGSIMPRNALPAEEGARELVRALGEHPLALQIAAVSLRNTPPTQLMDELERRFSGLRRGEARQRNQAMEVSIEHLLRVFDDDLRLALHRLGLLPVGGIEPLFLRVLHLQEEAWGPCRERLASAHLIHTLRIEGLTVPYLWLHPALVRYMSRRLTDAQRAAAVDDFYSSYMGLLNWLNTVDARAQATAEIIVRNELPNLRRTLHLLLTNQRLEQAVDYAGHLARFLDRLGLHEERDTVQARTQKTVEEALSTEGPLPRHVVRFIISQSQRMLAGGGGYQAAAMLQQLVERMGKEKGLAYEGDEATLDRAMALRRLGRAVHLGGRPDMAAGAYAQALAALRELPLADTVRNELTALYEHLPEVLMLGGQADAAQQITAQGIEFAQGLDDEHLLGVLTAQMGTVMAAKGETDEARQHLEQSLTHLTRDEDRMEASTVWTQLGALAEGLEDPDEAERCYIRALKLARAIEQNMLQAQILLRLARLSERQESWPDARQRYAKALRLFTAENARGKMVAVQLSLADIALRQGDLDEARVHAEAARALADKIVPGGAAWQPLVTLQRIAEAAGDQARVDEYRLRAQEAFARSPDAAGVLQRWGQLIRAVVASAKGEALDADAVNALEELETNTEWGQLAESIWRILGGERGEELYAQLDHIDALVVRAILRGIEAPEEQEDDSQ